MWTTENRCRYDRGHLRYESDLTDEEWAEIEPQIPAAKRGGPGKRMAMAEPKTELEELTERMKIAVGTDSGLGKSLKFNLKGDGFVYIDGGSVTNEDKPGFIGRFASVLGDARINIATFHLGRSTPGGDAIALVEVDGAVPADVLAKVQALPQVRQAKSLVF